MKCKKRGKWNWLSLGGGVHRERSGSTPNRFSCCERGKNSFYMVTLLFTTATATATVSTALRQYKREITVHKKVAITCDLEHLQPVRGNRKLRFTSK
ncbi:Protein of unknown function [Gryllus bimaculatus]|nr:Protein of unknown function [Gryllus bimaculatus]